MSFAKLSKILIAKALRDNKNFSGRLVLRGMTARNQRRLARKQDLNKQEMNKQDLNSSKTTNQSKAD
jgi:hypothetical protein